MELFRFLLEFLLLFLSCQIDGLIQTWLFFLLFSPVWVPLIIVLVCWSKHQK